MKKKVVSKEPVTEAKLKEVLKDYPTRTEMFLRFDKQDRTFDEKLTELKSDIFTRFDEMMGELAQQREDRLFTDHDVKDLKKKADEHEKRIKKLEATQSSS